MLPFMDMLLLILPTLLFQLSYHLSDLLLNISSKLFVLTLLERLLIILLMLELSTHQIIKESQVLPNWLTQQLWLQLKLPHLVLPYLLSFRFLVTELCVLTEKIHVVTNSIHTVISELLLLHHHLHLHLHLQQPILLLVPILQQPTPQLTLLTEEEFYNLLAMSPIALLV